MNQKIIDPIDSEVVEAELKRQYYLRASNKAGNEIYIFDAKDAPMAMREIGRLREIAFRTAGGGTGKDCDIDEYDLMEPACHQLVVWDPDSKLILGGYRFISGREIRLKADGQPRIATSHMFRFSQDFIDSFMPYTIELGRSFVRPEYQSSRAGAKALYALDNLWDGLGALTVSIPGVKYLFGKVTMYPSYSSECRDMILYFLNKYFPDADALVRPIQPLAIGSAPDTLARLFTGNTYSEDFKILNNEIRRRGATIPPLVHAYMSLSPTMRTFGTAINDEFGDVEETGIFVTVSDIFADKIARHVDSYRPRSGK